MNEPHEVEVESVKSKFTRAVKLAEELPWEVRSSAARAVDVGKRHITPGFLEALERYAAARPQEAAGALQRRLQAIRPHAGAVLIGGVLSVAGRQWHLYVDFEKAELIHADFIERP